MVDSFGGRWFIVNVYDIIKELIYNGGYTLLDYLKKNGYSYSYIHTLERDGKLPTAFLECIERDFGIDLSHYQKDYRFKSGE